MRLWQGIIDHGLEAADRVSVEHRLCGVQGLLRVIGLC